jgi:hypothetical protein
LRGNRSGGLRLPSSQAVAKIITVKLHDGTRRKKEGASTADGKAQKQY